MTHLEREATTVESLLAGAARTIRAVRYCWLVTGAKDGFVNGRPMGRLLHEPGEDAWILRCVVNGRTRKVAEVERNAEVALIFQDDASDAYVMLAGTARLLRDEAEVGRHWRPAFAVYFPTAADRASAMFIEIKVARMELWIRGVTPEPFGLQATRLERDTSGGWRLLSGLPVSA
jgi:general stress protein 26